jgi:hypothetical protein
VNRASADGIVRKNEKKLMKKKKNDRNKKRQNVGEPSSMRDSFLSFDKRNQQSRLFTSRARGTRTENENKKAAQKKK